MGEDLGGFHDVFGIRRIHQDRGGSQLAVGPYELSGHLSQPRTHFGGAPLEQVGG